MKTADDIYDSFGRKKTDKLIETKIKQQQQEEEERRRRQGAIPRKETGKPEFHATTNLTSKDIHQSNSPKLALRGSSQYRF
jgi:hypothetical protein